MGLLAKILTGKAASRVVNRAIARREARRAAPEYIPAGQVAAHERSLGSQALLDRATEAYRKNPKLVAGIATLAAAAVLASLKRKPH
jgi:hypothetical protein